MLKMCAKKNKTMYKLGLKKIFEFFFWIYFFIIPHQFLYPISNNIKKFDNIILSLNGNLSLQSKITQKENRISVSNHQLSYYKKNKNFLVTFNVFNKVDKSQLQNVNQNFREKKIAFSNSLFQKSIRESNSRNKIRENLIHKYRIYSNHLHFIDNVDLKTCDLRKDNFKDFIQEEILKDLFLEYMNLKNNGIINQECFKEDLYCLLFNIKNLFVENFYSEQNKNIFFNQIKNKKLDLKIFEFEYYANVIDRKFARKFIVLENELLFMAQQIDFKINIRSLSFSFAFDFNFHDSALLFQKQLVILEIFPIIIKN